MIGRFAARLGSREVGLLSLILAGALGVRLLGVSRGLPYIHTGDDPAVLSFVIGMLQRGDLNPHFFIYPSVYYYMLLPVTYLHYWYLHAHGMLSSPWEIEVYHPQAANNAYWWYLSPASFYLWGRTLTSLVGTATVYLVYRLGRTVYGAAAGLLGAAFLALAPGAVYQSDTVYVDIPMIFFVTLAILAGLGVIRHGRWRDYLLAGLLAGLAISTKTSAVIVVLALVVAHLLNARRAHLADVRFAAMALCVPAGYVLGTPYVVIDAHHVIGQARDAALAYGGIPSLAALRRALPEYLAFFVRPSQGGEWFVVPHTAMGLLPAVAALVGAVVGFRWNRPFHLYLLSFPVFFFLFMAGQRFTPLRSVLPVLPFAALFAAVGCLWAWQWLQTRWPAAAQTSRARALAGLALVALLAVPGREAVALGWTMGHRPDTRTAAVEWLRRHVAPGARVAFEEDLRWYLPDLYRLPFALRFAPRGAPLDWYLQQRIDVAAVGDQSPLRSFTPLATFSRPPYLHTGKDWVPDTYPVIDPALYIIKPKMPEINAGFPAEVDAGGMLFEPIVTDAAGMYSQTVHLPDVQFTPGFYTLAVTGEWPRPWVSLNDTITKLMAEVQIGQMKVATVHVSFPGAVNGTPPLRFTTSPFQIEQAQTLPVQVELTFWTQQRLPRRMWALRPSASGCATAPDAPNLNIQQMTLEAWVYLEGMNEPPEMRARGLESEGPILGKGKELGYYLRLVGDASGRAYADLSVAGRFSAGRAGFVPFRKWTHIAATYDGHAPRIYLNGTPAIMDGRRSLPDPGSRVHAEGAPLAVGCRDPGTPQQTDFRGLITGVRIWNRVLPLDTMRDEADLRLLPDTSAGLVGSWSFQSLVRGKVPDLTGAGNNLGAQALQRVPIEGGPLARPVWRAGHLNLLHMVKIERMTP